MSREEQQPASGTPQQSTTYQLFIVVLTFFSWLVVLLMFLGPTRSEVDAILWRVDSLVCIVFLVDFLLLLVRAPHKGTYLFRQGGWLDLIGSIPASPVLPWLAFLRVARLNRVLHIRRHLQGKEREELIDDARNRSTQTALLSIVFLAILLITVSSVLIVPIERTVADAEIRTGADAFWWSFVTVTTVGYGDYTPVTFPGRVLAMILMVVGIGIFAILTSFLAERLTHVQGDDSDDVVATIKAENAVLRAELAEIKELLRKQPS